MSVSIRVSGQVEEVEKKVSAMLDARRFVDKNIRQEKIVKKLRKEALKAGFDPEKVSSLFPDPVTV